VCEILRPKKGQLSVERFAPTYHKDVKHKFNMHITHITWTGKT